MARAHSPSKAIIVVGAITFTVSLLCVVCLRLLPLLHPFTSQLLVRLREVSAFLAFTTAIAIGILTSQRRGAAQGSQNKYFLEDHTIVGSIFGEPGYDTADAFNAHPGRHNLSSPKEGIELGQDKLHGGSFAATDEALSPQSMQSTGASMKSWPAQMPPATNSTFVAKQTEQRTLHRKSSSLDDSVVKALDESNSDPAYVVTDTHRTTKRVSFSMAPSSPKYVMSMNQSKVDPTEKDEDLSASSPGDLMWQADAFIAKFKEQLRMQNESILKYHRQA